MKRILITLAAVASMLLAGGSQTVFAASPTAGQCAGYNDPANTKVDTEDGTIVLEAGLTICVKASNGNTGEIITDGETSLAGYIEASGLLNNGGQVPGVSNYVLYGVPSPTPTPTPTPVITLYTVPSFDIKCGGSVTVVNFDASELDSVLITGPGDDVVIDESGTYPLEPGTYDAVGIVDEEVVTDKVTFNVVACATDPTPTPKPDAKPTPKPTTPPTDTVGDTTGGGGTSLPLVLLALAGASAGALLLTRKRA